MVFEVLSQKYKCGCGRGVNYYESKGLLDKINKLAEWDFISFPRTLQHDVEIEGETIPFFLEDRKFLGDDPELKPGNCILLGGQVIAFDSPDRMVLVVSDTGGFSLERIYKEHVEPEWSLLEETTCNVDFQFEDAPEGLEFDGQIPVNFPLYKVWKNLYLNGEEKEILIKVANPFPYELILRKWDVSYKTDEWEEDDLDLLSWHITEILSWFCFFQARDGSGIDHEKRNQDLLNSLVEQYQKEKCSGEQSEESV